MGQSCGYGSCVDGGWAGEGQHSSKIPCQTDMTLRMSCKWQGDLEVVEHKMCGLPVAEACNY